MKRIIAVWIALVMVITGIPFTVSALEHADGWQYVYISDNQVEIVGHTQALQGKVVLPTVVDGRRVTSIGKEAFQGCDHLQEVVLPEGVISIGDRAFHGCRSLKKIQISASVTAIGNQVWGSCESLSQMTVADENPAYMAVDNVLYDKAMEKLICCPAGKTGEAFTVPEGVTVIGYGAFEGCGFTNIVLPEGLTTIEAQAFKVCMNLTAIEIPQTVTVVGDTAFYYCRALETIIFTNGNLTFGDSVFSNCHSLQQITIPEGVTTITIGMFVDCSALTDITLPESLTTIEYGAFESCSKLRSIVLPKNVTTIQADVFHNCSDITVTVPMNTTDIGSHIFGMKSVTAKVRGYRGSYAQYYVEIYRYRNGSITFEPVDYDLTDGSQYSLPVGHILDFSIPDLPAGETVHWKSEDETVATVDEGVVTAVGPGRAVITAQYTAQGEERTISCKVICLTHNLGDVSTDGNINAYDALLTLQAAVGSLTLTSEQSDLADWNCDGKLDATDALQILRHAVI